MRIALISDLHGNLEATNAVMWEIDRLNPDYVICLGDLIGYGPNPDEVVEIVRERGYDTVMGNHDAVLTGKPPFSFFREPNQSLLRKSVELLSEENKSWLKSRPMMLESDSWIAVHASPVEPEIWTYLDSSIKCQAVLRQTDKQFVFVGHTHRAGIVANEFGVFGLKPGYRFVINPGSVGQSRDGDHRASFMLIDTEKLISEHLRITYEYSDTLKSYERLGIPESDAHRLLGLSR